MTYLIPFEGETHFTAPCVDYLLETVLEPREVKIQPVMKTLRAVRRRYSDSELSTAAIMMDKLRKGEDRATIGVDSDEVLDGLVEKLIEKLD